MRPIIVAALCLILTGLSGQAPTTPPLPPRPGSEPEERLPNGKSQKDAIAKEDYKKSLEDARELVKLAESLESEIEKNDQYVVSIAAIRKTEDIEKLSKRIRGRLKRF